MFSGSRRADLGGGGGGRVAAHLSSQRRRRLARAACGMQDVQRRDVRRRDVRRRPYLRRTDGRERAAAAARARRYWSARLRPPVSSRTAACPVTRGEPAVSEAPPPRQGAQREGPTPRPAADRSTARRQRQGADNRHAAGQKVASGGQKCVRKDEF